LRALVDTGFVFGVREPGNRSTGGIQICCPARRGVLGVQPADASTAQLDADVRPARMFMSMRTQRSRSSEAGPRLAQPHRHSQGASSVASVFFGLHVIPNCPLFPCRTADLYVVSSSWTTALGPVTSIDVCARHGAMPDSNDRALRFAGRPLVCRGHSCFLQRQVQPSPLASWSIKR